MIGVLIAAHGSREKSTEQTLEALAEKVCRISGISKLEIAFMQFSARTIPAGLDKLTAQGCTEIVLIPYFLFDGVHIRQDIPELIEGYKTEHPGVSIRLGHTLGEDDRLAQILAEQALAAFALQAGEEAQ
jgi:sirohydrochlorin ferrochelatase